MESQVITEFGKPLQRLQAPTPTPQGTEVLVKVEHCGVCHSDVHIHDGYFDMGGGAKLPLGLPLPHTLGHEVAGEVVALGPDATGVKVGRAPRGLFLDRLRQVRRLPAGRGELLRPAAQRRLLGRHARRLLDPRARAAPALPAGLRLDPARAGGHLHVLGPDRIRRDEEGPAARAEGRGADRRRRRRRHDGHPVRQAPVRQGAAGRPTSTRAGCRRRWARAPRPSTTPRTPRRSPS